MNLHHNISIQKSPFRFFLCAPVVLIVVLLYCLIPRLSFAQTTPSSDPCSGNIANETHDQLQADLNACNAEIAQWQATLDASKKNTASLVNDAAVLTAKINQAKTYIKQKNIQIAQLSQSIADKSQTITDLEQRISNSDDSLSQLIRNTNQLDSYSLAEVILSKRNISDFFSDADSYSTIDSSLEALLGQIRDTKDLTEQQKADLATQKDQQTDLVVAAQTQANQVAADEKQKQYLIQVNKTQEKTYTQVIADQQAKAAQIKAKLFNLAGGSAAIPFGTALTYAQNSASETGIDPAFLLAIITQESSLGANVGQCYLTDTTTGAGVGKNTGTVFSNVMKPTRDVQPFLDITNQLGFDPFKTAVSCPIAGVGGYGGAMGPAQFIASTWALFQDRLQSALGHFGNPWDPQDAFTASSLYLTDLGAVGTSYTAQIRAACKYYGSGGSTCSYGRSVMNLASSIQSDIDYLNQYGISRR
jgi:peptidoglycan hydrolase CwlO-like protein